MQNLKDKIINTLNTTSTIGTSLQNSYLNPFKQDTGANTYNNRTSPSSLFNYRQKVNDSGNMIDINHITSSNNNINNSGNFFFCSQFI